MPFADAAALHPAAAARARHRHRDADRLQDRPDKDCTARLATAANATRVLAHHLAQNVAVSNHGLDDRKSSIWRRRAGLSRRVTSMAGSNATRSGQYSDFERRRPAGRSLRLLRGGEVALLPIDPGTIATAGEAARQHTAVCGKF